MAARWAAFRAEELAQLAQQAEPRSRAVAHALWTHVACLDGRRAEVAAALERTRPVRVQSAAFAWLREPAAGSRTTAREAALRLGEPVALVGLRTPLPAVGEGGPAALARAETAVAEARRALREARFQDAANRVEQARRELPAASGSAELREARTQLEVLGATAELALGREAEARAGFERALVLDPDLELDPAEHSPKVFRMFRSVREAVRGGEGPR